MALTTVDRIKKIRQKMDEDMISGSEYNNVVDRILEIRNPAVAQAYTPSNAAPTPVTSTPLSKFVTPSTPTLADTFSTTPKLNTAGRTPIQTPLQTQTNPVNTARNDPYLNMVTNPAYTPAKTTPKIGLAQQAAAASAAIANPYIPPTPPKQPNILQKAGQDISNLFNQKPQYASVDPANQTPVEQYKSMMLPSNSAAQQAKYLGMKAAGGALGSVENLADYAIAAPSALIGNIADLGGNFPNPVSKMFKDNAALHLARKTVGSAISESADKLSGVPSPVKYLGSTAENIGGMIPSIAAEIATSGAAPTPLDAAAVKAGSTFVRSLKNFFTPSTAVFGLGAAGSYAKQGYEKSGDVGKSLEYGALGGIAEVTSEKLFAGLAGTGMGESIIKSGLKNKVLEKVLDLAGEGAEEMITTGVEPFLQRLTGVDKNAPLAALKDYGESFLGGVTLAAFMSAATYPFKSRYDDAKSKVNFAGILNSQSAAINELMPDREPIMPLDINNVTDDAIEQQQNEIRSAADDFKERLVGSVSDNTSENTQTHTNANFDTTVNDSARQFNPTAAELADKLGVKVEFSDLGRYVNGKYDPVTDTLHISTNADQPEIEIFKHELTHYLEKSNNYDNFKSFVLNSPEFARMLQRQGTTIDEYRNDIADMYAASGQKLNSTDEIDREIAANFAKNLFTSQAQVNRLANTNPNLFQRVWNWVKDTAYKFANRNDSTAVFIRNAEKMYADAWANLQRQSGTQTRISTEPQFNINENPVEVTPQHTPEQRRVIQEYNNAADPEISEFVNTVKTTKLPDKTSITVEEQTPPKMAEDIKNKIGLDVTDYKIDLRADIIRHIDKRHGESGTGDRSMANPDDIARIPYVLNNYDGIRQLESHSSFFNSDGTRASVMQIYKKIDGHYFITEAIPDTKTKTIQIVSAYQNKNLVESEWKNPPTITSETASTDNIITQPNENVNRNLNQTENNNTNNPQYAISEKPLQARRDLMRTLRNNYGVEKMSAAERDTFKSAVDIATEENNINNPEVRAELLRMLVESGTAENPNYTPELEQARTDIRNTRLYISPDTRAELTAMHGGDYAVFSRDAFANKLKPSQTRDGATNIDTFYEELQNTYGKSTFPDANHQAEMLQNMLDFVKGNQKQIPFTDMVAIRAKEYGVTTDELIQGYDNQLERELEKYGVKAQGEVNMRKRVNEIKAAWAEDVAAQRKEVRDRIRAAAQRRSIDNNIMKTLNELDSMKKKANPADREMLNELVSQFDTKAKSGLSDKSKLDVDAWIKKFDKSSDNTIDTPDAIQEKIDRFDKKNVADLNVQEASDLLAVAKFLKAQVRKNHTLFEGNKEIDAYKKGEQAIEQIKQSRNVIVGDKTGFATLSPKNFFRRISGNNPDSVFSQAYNDLNKGQLKTWEFKRDNLKPVTDFMENNKKLWQSWQGKDAEFIDTGIKRDDMPGKSPTLKITPMQRISLYMHSKNQDNMRHILNGGIVTPDAKLYKDGKLKEAYEKGTQFMLTKADVKSIINGMSAEEKFFADKLLHPYFNVDSKKAINSTSMLLDGYEKADVNNYFPITTDKDYVNRDFSGLVKDGTLEGMGLLKKRTNSANPITLEDASDVFLNSLDNVSKYYGLAVPIRNISTLLNVKMQGWQGSVSKELTNKFGGQALKYIENILGDLQFARTERSLLDKAISGYAKSSISGNVGSALQQPTALFNALPELGIHTLNPLNFRPVKSETMEKYSSLYWFRKQGNTTPEIAEITRNQKWDKHVPFFMKMTEITDDWNMKRIWNGAELYVRATDKSLKPRSEEFYKAVGAKFDEVLLNTQSNNTTLQKAAIMRSHNPLVNAVTLFQNQMYVTYNQMLTAAGDVEYAFKTGKGKKAAVNKMALTSAGVILSSLTAALALGLYKGLQGNEPDDLKAATVRNIIGYLPFGQIGFDFVNSLVTDTKWDKDFNGLQVANVGMLNTFGTDLQALADIYSKVTGQGGWNWREGKKQLLGPTKKAALDLSRFFGVPAANFEKLITGAVGGSLDFAVEKNILPERFAGFREGEQNFFSEFSKSDLTYASQNKTPFAFRNEFNIVLDNSLNKGSFLNKNTFSIDAKNEIYRLYNTSGKSDVVPNPNVTKVGDVDLTLQQQIDYGQRYAETIQKPLENLLKSALYKSFSDDDKLKAVKALYSYANGVAGKSVSPEYEQAAWVANVESISKTVPVETAIALRNEFNRDGSDGKALYNTTQKRKMLFDNKSLTPVQKQAFDAKLLGGDKKDEKTGVITYGGADYTNTGNFALSLLPEAKIKNYTDYKLSGIITKEQYASAYNALAATGKELEDNDEKWALTDWSVRNKDGTYGATITNSASLLKREALEKALAGIPVTQVRGRNYRADIYLAFGIGKTVAEMSQAEFIRELKAVNRTYTNNLKYKENAELKNKIKKAG